MIFEDKDILFINETVFLTRMNEEAKNELVNFIAMSENKEIRKKKKEKLTNTKVFELIFV